MNIFLVILISTLFSVSAFAKYKKVDETTEVSKFSTNLNLGYSLVNENKDNILNFDIYANYLFAEKVGAFVGLGKYFGDSSKDISDTSGTIGSQISAGFTFALTGSLQNKKTTRYYSKTETKNHNNNVYIFSNRVTRRSLNDIDGFRISIFGSSNEYSAINTSQFGLGGKLFYEQRLSETFLVNYGLKYDYIDTSKIYGNFFQGYIGIVIIP